MANYSVSTYSIKVTTPYKFEVVNRSNSEVEETIDLTYQNVKIVYNDNDDTFSPIGTVDIGENDVNYVLPDDNDVFLSTGAEIDNINGDTIDIRTSNAFMQKDGSDVMFSETQL